jgi:hypothetical protein
VPAVSEIVQEIIEQGLRLIGLVILKLVTLGRYRAPEVTASFGFEGVIGLATVAAARWTSCRLL